MARPRRSPLGGMMTPASVQVSGRRTAKVRPHSIVISVEDLDVVVVDPPDPKVFESKVDDAIKIAQAVITVAGKIWGGGGGGQGGGGGKVQCRSTITQTQDPNTGVITTTIVNECTPVPA